MALETRINHILKLRDDLLKHQRITNREAAVEQLQIELTRQMNILTEERNRQLEELELQRNQILQKIAEETQNSAEHNEVLALEANETSNPTNEHPSVHITGESDIS